MDGERRSRTGEGLFRGAGKGWGGGCTHCPLSIFVFWIKFWAATFIKVYNSAKENTALADPLSSLKIQVSPLGSSHRPHRDYLPCPDSSPSDRAAPQHPPAPHLQTLLQLRDQHLVALHRIEVLLLLLQQPALR